MTGPFLNLIVAGRKTVESRFHRQRRTPLFSAKPGDVVIFRQSGRPASVAAVLGDTYYLEIAEFGIDQIRATWAPRIGCDDDDFWAARSDARWVSLLLLDSVFSIPPQPLYKRDRQAWVSYPCSQHVSTRGIHVDEEGHTPDPVLWITERGRGVRF
jgi:hypothetical protein